MQIFVPYSDPLNCAKALFLDKKRFNNQINECNQIIKAITGKSEAWKHHPVTKMYSQHVEWLKLYSTIFSLYKNFIVNDTKETLLEINSNNNIANKIKPSFLTEDFCNQHKRRLFTKNKKAFSCFSSLGESQENWYFVNNQLLVYGNNRKK